ncbi:MAG: 4-(cytidine 5'-diphospho)-2-C-methyl-D-erythritol kinase [Thermodesulfobacteriota bacterium]|nr:4-(cytidine 5'-diphospho)-2-C-methyl-D-erythritol kinase [Thermodesulfobacteriota bacterium]
MVTNLPTKKIRTPAKLNIRLKVTGRRPDGYHEVVSIMVPINLCDHLELEKVCLGGITLACRGLYLPNDESNLVYRAATAFFSMTGIRPGLHISLTKRIPVAAGLGGGSSNAGCTLKALNDMWQNPLTSRDLADLAVRLGADVPFFLECRPCIATGIGEILEPIEKWPKFWYVIVTPTFGVATSWVYSNLKIELTTAEHDSIIKNLEKASLDVADILENDLETVTGSHFPAINTIKDSLMDAGAQGALMSGSGPSVFGVFRSKNQAVSAKRQLMAKNMGDVFAVEGL